LNAHGTGMVQNCGRGPDPVTPRSRLGVYWVRRVAPGLSVRIRVWVRGRVRVGVINPPP